tara:strand:- start:17 stop:211 length:195 start_codon:yes stop_codon:yes gene_type:complete
MVRRKFTTYDKPKQGVTLAGFSKDKKETPIWALRTPKQLKFRMGLIFTKNTQSRISKMLRIRKK